MKAWGTCIWLLQGKGKYARRPPFLIYITKGQDASSSSASFHVAICLNTSWTSSWFALCQSAAKTVCTVPTTACKGFRKGTKCFFVEPVCLRHIFNVYFLSKFACMKFGFYLEQDSWTSQQWSMDACCHRFHCLCLPSCL